MWFCQRKVGTFFAILTMVVLSNAFDTFAGSHYVRAGASGNGNTWDSAYSALPSTMIRGDTYYVADGTYPGRTFSTPISGTMFITVKKATIADHGIAAGWNDSLGNGQAKFTGVFNFSTSNWIIDGQTRNETNWFDSSAYGFSIGRNIDQNQISIRNYGNIPDNITIRYVYLPGWSAAMPGTTQRIYAVDVDDYDGGSESTGLLFSRMYVTGSNNCWFIRTTRGAVIEYCASSGAEGNSANHGEIVNCYYSAYDVTIRYNQFRNAYLVGGSTAIVAIAVGRNDPEKPRIDCYGNVFSNFRCGDAAIGFLGNAANGGNGTNCHIYNNTFVNGTGGTGIQFPDGSGNVISNNLWINCGNPPVIDAGSGGMVSNNAFGTGGNGRGTNAQVSVPTSIFVNYAGGNFQLASATTAAIALSAPYDKDLLGNTRGGDNTWDRGAYEYNASPVIKSVALTISPVKSGHTLFRIYDIQGRFSGIPIDKNIRGGASIAFPTPGIYFSVVGEGAERKMSKTAVIR